LGVDRIVFIPPEPGDVTGHADGMVAWIGADTLIVNRYTGRFRSKFRQALDEGLPHNVRIVEVPYEPSGQVLRGFPSAIGNYVNMLVSSKIVLMPSYGLIHIDDEINQIMSLVTKRVALKINSSAIARYGGSLNCISWQYCYT